MAESTPKKPTLEDLRLIVEEGMRSDPRNYVRFLEGDPSPIVDMFGSSGLINAYQQSAADKLGNTGLGRRIDALFPEQVTPNTLTDYLQRGIANIPLGGFSDEYKRAYSQDRADDVKLRRGTAELGKVPVYKGDSFEEAPADTFRQKAAQLGGIALGDLGAQALLNVWWFINAPQAVATLAALGAVHAGGRDFRNPGAKGPLIGSRNLRLATAVPAWIAASAAVGNYGRQPGYKAVVPSEADPTVTADPLGEFGSRFVLGRAGGLLPYEEFVQERPDVSRSEYEAYKAYLFGSNMPLKATLDGIHGPEVTFLGKSIPVATGVVPVVAAALGAGAGIRKAGARLLSEGKLAEADRLQSKITELQKTRAKPEAIEQAKKDLDDVQRKNEFELVKQALLFSSLGAGGGAIAGGGLESLRRALKGRADLEPEDPIAPVTTGVS